MKPLNIGTSAQCYHVKVERGVALIVVMVLLLLGTILILSSTRTNWLNEALVSNESDYQRAYSAAEALIRDAESDVRGLLPGGAPINPGNPVFFAGSGRQINLPYYPLDHNDLDQLITSINALPNPPSGPLPCRMGICVPLGIEGLGANWWDDPVRFAEMTSGAGNAARFARYGQFTNANPAATGNPLLLANPVLRAWYWVEVFQFNAGVTPRPAGMPIPDIATQPFFFRITAVVLGQKPGTRVVLRTVFVPRPSAE